MDTREDTTRTPDEPVLIDLERLFLDPEETKWMDLPLCTETSPELFFPEQGGSVREAKRICGRCEVQTECLEYALKNNEVYGIWGGMSPHERRDPRRHLMAASRKATPAPEPPNVSDDGRPLLTTQQACAAVGVTYRDTTAARDLQLRGFPPEGQRGRKGCRLWDERTIREAPKCRGCGYRFKPTGSTLFCSTRCHRAAARKAA